jgi:hypothetical protein
LSNHLSRTARRKKPDATFVQSFRQVKETRLVVDGEDSCYG